MYRHLILALGLLIVETAGCAQLPADVGMATTPPPQRSAVITSTDVVWFPPTETPAAAIAVTPLPTAEKKTGVGELLIADDMTTSTHWNASPSGDASASISGRGLTISAQPGEPPVISLHRSAVLDNMYIEVAARLSLCRNRDAYGLVFRAPNDVAHYRLVAICDGTAAAERVSLGGPRALQPPTASSDVPAGAPGEVRLGVWAQGDEFRFFLNDRYQFTVTDSNYASGGFGVFVQSGGQTPAVVTFSDLAVYRLEPASPAETPGT